MHARGIECQYETAPGAEYVNPQRARRTGWSADSYARTGQAAAPTPATSSVTSVILRGAPIRRRWPLVPSPRAKRWRAVAPAVRWTGGRCAPGAQQLVQPRVARTCCRIDRRDPATTASAGAAQRSRPRDVVVPGARGGEGYQSSGPR